MATKPTKQQAAQAKARAGGNNPIKVTNKGLKKLGGAALIAASFTPAGRVAKGVATVAKAAKAEGIMAKAGWNAAAKTNYRAQVKREATANARGLKAAQKPTNKTGAKADRAQRAELQGNSNLIKNASPARANRTRGGSLYAQQTYGGQGLVSKNLTPKQAARQAEITKELNPVRASRTRSGNKAK